MDYEKKYNEALKWMRELYPGLHGATKEDAEHYFPELRESEDERIRKYLVEELKAAKSVGELKFTIPQPTREECIAYLEKQKEHHIPWYDYQKSKEAGYTIVPNEEYEQLIKQKEHKPVECSEVELEFRGEKVTVKRPFYRDDKGRGYSTAELDEGVAWNALRAWCEKKGISLYDLYPKAEWSEEDERIVGRIQMILEFFDRNYPADMNIGSEVPKYISWLKSLRPSWKPSEEQMMKDFPKWRRIKEGERLPCPAYVWTIVYDNYPGCFEGRLMPNVEGVRVGRDTWYLPVDVIHNLPKED